MIGTPLGQRSYTILVRNLRAFASAHHNCLEVLGGHHSSHARASVSTIGIADQRTKEHSLLTAGPTLKNLNAIITKFFPDYVLHVGCELAPQL